MKRWLAAAAPAALLVLAGCGEDDKSQEAAQPVGEESGGSVVQYADCGNWRAGTVPERRATVVELRRQLTPQTSKTGESPFSDERAYEVLDHACSPTSPESLRLYKLYVRAQGFAPLSE